MVEIYVLRKVDKQEGELKVSAGHEDNVKVQTQML